MTRAARWLRRWGDAALHCFDPRGPELDGLDEEIADHVDRLERAALCRGVPAHRARAEALRAFGDPGRARRRTVRTLMKERIMLRIAAAGAVALAGAGGLVMVAAAPHTGAWAKVAPYTALELEPDGSVLVKHDGQWWRLVSIDGVGVDELREVAAASFGEDDVEKRLAEDPYEVLVAAGWVPGKRVDLALEPIEGGDVRTFEGVAMDHDKRTAAWHHRHGMTTAAPAADTWRRIAPFTALELEHDNTLSVRYDGAWWTLESIDGITSAELVRTAKDMFLVEHAEKRLAEDIAEVLTACGWSKTDESEPIVEMVLIDPASRERVVVDAPMTHESRRAAWMYRRD